MLCTLNVSNLIATVSPIRTIGKNLLEISILEKVVPLCVFHLFIGQTKKEEELHRCVYFTMRKIIFLHYIRNHYPSSRHTRCYVLIKIHTYLKSICIKPFSDTFFPRYQITSCLCKRVHE